MNSSSTIKIKAVHDVYGSFNNTVYALFDQHELSDEDNSKVGHISVETQIYATIKSSCKDFLL